MKQPRPDALPENSHYHDDGCDVAPHCLSCPLPACRYDVVGGVRTMRNEVRDEAIIGMNGGGATIDAIPARYGVNRRTVFRVLQVSRVQA